MKREWDKDKREEGQGEEVESFVIYGKNPVLEALRAGQNIEKILVLKDNTDHVLGDIMKKARGAQILVQTVDKKRLDDLSDRGLHQGVAAVVPPYDYAELEEIIAGAQDNSLVVILDHLTDPHNFGAIIRSANLCGAAGVIVPKRRAVGITPTVIKASSGALAHTKVARVGNLTQAMDKLKAAGFWVAGTEMRGEAYYRANLKGKLAVVIGNEGKGLSPKVAAACDLTLSIPNYGQVDSFNASAAAAVILAEAARQQHDAK